MDSDRHVKSMTKCSPETKLGHEIAYTDSCPWIFDVEYDGSVHVGVWTWNHSTDSSINRIFGHDIIGSDVDYLYRDVYVYYGVSSKFALQLDTYSMFDTTNELFHKSAYQYYYNLLLLLVYWILCCFLISLDIYPFV